MNELVSRAAKAGEISFDFFFVRLERGAQLFKFVAGAQGDVSVVAMLQKALHFGTQYRQGTQQNCRREPNENTADDGKNQKFPRSFPEEQEKRRNEGDDKGREADLSGHGAGKS